MAISTPASPLRGRLDGGVGRQDPGRSSVLSQRRRPKDKVTVTLVDERWVARPPTAQRQVGQNQSAQNPQRQIRAALHRRRRPPAAAPRRPQCRSRSMSPARHGQPTAIPSFFRGGDESGGADRRGRWLPSGRRGQEAHDADAEAVLAAGASAHIEGEKGRNAPKLRQRSVEDMPVRAILRQPRHRSPFSGAPGD